MDVGHNMKKTYSLRILDWILVGISLFFSVLTVWNLTTGFDFFSGYLVRIVFALASITAVLSLLISRINGERFSRIFILVVLLLPPLLIANLFITDLVFYGATRTDLLQDPSLYLKLVSGLILLFLTLKYSKQQKEDRRSDYGVLIIGVGIFAICYALTLTIEPYFNTDLSDYPIWKTIVNLIIGITTMMIGIQLKVGKLKFNKGLILTLILMFIFGLI